MIHRTTECATVCCFEFSTPARPRKMSLRIVLIVAFSLNTIIADSVSFDVNEISDVIEATFACHENPGLAVSVVRDGQVLLSKGFGVTDLDSRKPVSSSTLFGIASVSKGFAATLLVKLLYEKTNLTVDSRVQEFLGEQFLMPDSWRTQETTFADLMAHRTGVPANNRIRFDTNFTRDTLLQRLHLLPSPDQFRVKYYYSNLMYGLVSRLAELIGGGQWEDLVSEHLFEPLGMNKSTFATRADFTRDDVAVAYENRNEGLFRVPPEFSKKWAEMVGSGAVMSTVDDMAKWMNFHLHGGQTPEGQRVMQTEHLEEVHKPRFLITPTTSKDTRVPQFPVTTSEEIYAHGFRRGYYRGYERLSHSGSTLGYRALLTLLPEQKIGVFTALSGSDDSYKYRVPLHMYLMDRALGLEPWLNSSTICSYPEPWKPQPKPSSEPRLDANVTLDHSHQEYEGTYHNEAYGYLHLSYNETLSTLVMTYGWGSWQLFRQNLTSKTGTEKFYGKSLGITSINVSPIYIVAKSGSGNDVILSVMATAFESNVPPVFEKMGGKANSSSEIMTNFYILSLCGALLIFLLA